MLKVRNYIFILLSVFSLSVLAACDDDESEGTGSESGSLDSAAITLNHSNVTVIIGKTYQLKTVDDNTVNWTSSDETVATVSSDGLVTGVSRGNVVITATNRKHSASCNVLVCTTGLWDPSAALGASLTADIVYSNNVLLYAPHRVMQSFDVVEDGSIFYSQLNVAGDADIVAHGDPYQDATTASKCMFLYYFGHGAQMVAEDGEDGKYYIWMNSNATILSSGEYWNGLSFSRIEWSPTTSYEDGYAGETFFLNRGTLPDQNVAIDFVNRRMLVGALQSGCHFYIFDYDEVMALPLKTMTTVVKIGSYNSDSITRVMEARDLADVEPIGSFTVKTGSNYDTDIYSYSQQGYEIWGDYVYFYEGNGLSSSTASDEFDSYAYVTVFDKDGNVVVPRTQVMAVSDKTGLINMGMSTSGYAEAEGIKIRNGKLYLGIACRTKEDANRRQAVLVYDLVQAD